jgi:hypothetical protein
MLCDVFTVLSRSLKGCRRSALKCITVYSTRLYTLGENGSGTEAEEEEKNSVQLIFNYCLLCQISEGNYCFLSMHYSITLFTYSYILIYTALYMY